MKRKLHHMLCKLIFLVAMFVFLVMSSCRKLVESPIPSDSIAETSVYAVDATAIAVLDAVYISMNAPDQPFQGNRSIGLLAGLSADEYTLYNGVTTGTVFYYYRNSLSQALGTVSSGAEQWPILYNYVYKCNAAIEGLNKSTTLTPTIKKQLLGEAKFLRAFFYFYLVNLYGDVPLALTTDPEVNNFLSRSPKTDVYKSIVVDLKEAEELLSENFLSGTILTTTTERVRPTKWAANALLGRVYLYIGDWEKAENRTSLVINNTTLFGPLPGLNNVFLKNSQEVIWQIQPTDINFNTTEAKTLVIPPTGLHPSGNPAYLSKQWLSIFESNDQRKFFGNWVDTTIYKISNNPVIWDTIAFCYKYKKNEFDPNIISTSTVPGYTKMSEYFMMLRLGEQYLIRAEARAKQGKLAEGISDLDVIRERAGLQKIAITNPGISQSILLDTILHERRVELFGEWGHRWFDLKRTGKIDQVMSVHTPLKSNGSVQWQPYQALCPILLNDIRLNPNLVQNPGY